MCSRGHELDKCEEFRKKTYEERVQIVRRDKICNNCFKLEHFARGCFERKHCGLPECRRKLHTLLHPPQHERENPVQKSKSVQVDSEPSRDCNVAGTKRSNVYLRIVPVKVIGTDGRTVETYALPDSGSDVSLCDKRLISELGLGGVEKTFSLTTLNEVKRGRCGLEVDWQV